MDDFNSTAALMFKARASGKASLRRLNGVQLAVNYAGNCQSPQEVERFARPNQLRLVDPGLAKLYRRWGIELNPAYRRSKVYGRHSRPIWVKMAVPCRKCDNCHRRRRAMWSIRAKSEWRAAQRTWFGTLTLGPNALQVARDKARRRVARNYSVDECTGEITHDDFDKLSEPAKMARLHEQLSPVITRYLKRVRKGSLPYHLRPWRRIRCEMYGVPLVGKFRYFDARPTKFRFLCVAELGDKNGRLHYHVLLHEPVGGEAIRHALIEGQWAEIGFSDWELVEDPDRASYVCKYLHKRTIARVRASERYGEAQLRPNDIALLREVRPPQDRQHGTISNEAVPRDPEASPKGRPLGLSGIDRYADWCETVDAPPEGAIALAPEVPF